MALVGWARHHTIGERSAELASQMLKPGRAMPVRQQRLPQQPPHDPVNAVHQGGRGQPPPRPVGQRPQPRARRPSSAGSGRPESRDVNPPARELKGCYHCGAPDHSRSAKDGRPGCLAFARLIEQNGGLPQGYKGALERFLEEKQKATHVKALQPDDGGSL